MVETLIPATEQVDAVLPAGTVSPMWSGTSRCRRRRRTPNRGSRRCSRRWDRPAEGGKLRASAVREPGLAATGRRPVRLVRTRYLRLTGRGNMTPRQRRAFTPLHRSSLRVARAWRIKETDDAAVGLPLAGLGGADVAALIRVGDSQSPEADQGGGADDQAALGRGDSGDRHGADERHRRALRSDQSRDLARLRLRPTSM